MYAALRKWVGTGAVAAAVIGSPMVAHGQGPLGASGFSPVRTTHSVAPFEHVDPFSGNLLLTFTDLELPGNAGLDLRVQRVYNSKIHLDYHDTHNHFKQRTWVGLGWSLHFGRVLHAESADVTKRVVEMSDGSGHALFNALSGDPDNSFGAAVTSELWRYDAATHTLRLPDGRTYIFGQIGIGGGPDGQVRYVTEINDQYGNKLLFDYFTGGGGAYPGPTDGVRRIRQGLGGGEERQVTFTAVPLVHGYALATMQYAGRTWTYAHTEPASDPTQLRLLGTSGPVAGTTWSFTYRDDSPGSELLTVAGPFGGELRYTYGDQYSHIYSTANTVRTRVVTTRETRVTPSVVDGTWTFQYGTGPYENTSIVTGPTRRETFRYIGIGLSTGDLAAFAPWIVGALERHAVETVTGTLLQETANTWLWSLPVSQDNVEPPEWDDQDPLPYAVWGAAEVRKAMLSKAVTTRGPQTWTTELTYDSTLPYRYNHYFRPLSTVSWHHAEPARTRTTSQTFWYGTGATPYIRDRIASSTMTVGSESVASSFTYQSGTGFMTGAVVRGVPTTFTRTSASRGNVATVTDAAGKVTSFTYSSGVPVTIDGPDASPTIGVDITRTVNPDGTIATERVGPSSGGLSTTFAYDALMRVTSVAPPGGGIATTTSYATPSQQYHQTTRGTTYARTYLDGFGRAIRSEDAYGVKTRVEFDAVGRVTRQYLPYTTGTGTRFTQHAYDALDRPTTVIAADGTSVTAYTYNGSEVWITDPESRTTVYHYYSDSGPGGGQLEMVRDPASQQTTYTYDIAGNLRTTAGPVSGGRTWTYNAQGRLATETHPESGTTTYTWNLVGTLASVTTPNTDVLTYTYDNAHRLVGRDAPGSSYDLGLTYDTLGRTATRTFGGVTTTLSYDTAGRPSARADTVGGVTFTSQYGYDTLDRLVTMQYPSANSAAYQYEAGGRLVGVTWMGQPLATLQYHPETGSLTSYVTGPVTHTVTHDVRDRLATLTSGSGVAPSALSLQYTYDRSSLVTAIADARPGQSQVFAYDALGRLRSAAGAYGSIDWKYDAAGNRTEEKRSHPGGTATYAYTAGRLTSVSGASSGIFSYGADGRTTAQTVNGVTTTFAYTSTALPTSVSTPTATALSVYDADEWRIARQVTVAGATSTHYSVRGLDTATLSEYLSPCTGCALAWTSDHIYGGGRLLASFAAPPSDPVVEFVGSASANTVSWATPGFLVKVTTSTGAATVAPITVPYATIDASGGTATAGVDYVPASGVLSIPAGTASGATVAITVAVIDDAMDEPDETVLLRLGSPTNARLGMLETLTYTIQDNDATPTLSVTSVTVSESTGQALVVATLSAASGYTVTATATTTAGTAVATHDFTPASVPLSFPSGTVSLNVVVSLTNDGYAEPDEAFTVALSAVTHATVAGPGSATVTVVDDDGPREVIDPALPGDYFALAHTTAGDQTYLQIFNPHPVAVTARITYVRHTGQGVRRTYTLAPKQRLGLHVNADAFILPNVPASAVVQSLDPARPLVAELSDYYGAGWAGGEATEGVTPAPAWSFAEGATGLSVGFEEYFTVFNPTDEPLIVAMTFYGHTGTVLLSKTVHVPAGPGLSQVHVNADLPWSEHSTHVVAAGRETGLPRAIVVERLMRWQGHTEGHRSTGARQSHSIWEFAEGGTSSLMVTYLALWNPNPTATTVRVFYRHEDGNIYSEDVPVPGRGRAVVGAPSWVPAGGYGLQMWSLDGQWYVAERMVYGGASWAFGHASPGTIAAGPSWRFAEGTGTGGFDTFFLLTNVTATPATVTVTYWGVAGTVLGTTPLVVPPYQRGTVWANGTTGVQEFSTEVTSTQPIVAERAMYWPTGGASSLAAPDGPASLATADAELSDSRARPSPYTLTAGTPGPTVERSAATREVVVGKRSPSSRGEGAAGTAESLSSPPPWYGSHLTVGKKP